MNLQEIKNQTDIVQVISQYLTLTRKGKGYSGLCPFHDDRTPSLTVDPERQRYKCYACGANGDVISFVKENEKCTFGEAVQKITGSKTGTLPPVRPSAKPPRKPGPTLPVTPVAGIPYLPAVPGLAETYLAFEVMQAYHIQPPEWKQMRGRILFPVKDEHGQLAGYAGRGDTPRYLNTPGLPRGQILYGLNLAKPEIIRTGVLCLVEGFKDVLAMHAAGWKNTVGLCGTQMAEGQKELILRYAEQVVVIMDGDQAGRNAAEKIICTLSRAGMEVICVDLPEGSDPDSLFCDHGGEALARCIHRYVKAPHPSENLLITALTLYPEITTLFGEERLPYPLLTRQITREEDIPFESEINREILLHYAHPTSETTGTTAMVEEVYRLQIAYGEPIRRLAEEIKTYRQCSDNEAQAALLHYALLAYCETRLIRLTKHLTRSLSAGTTAPDRRRTLLDLTRRREQLTVVSRLLNTAGAKK